MLNTFRKHIPEKFAEYIRNGRFDNRWTLEQCLERSRNWPDIPDVLRHEMAITFGLSASVRVWMRALQRGPHFQLFFIGADNEVVEICSYRTLRQFGKKWYHRYIETNPTRTPEQERIWEIFKFKSFVKIQGGLMRGEKLYGASHIRYQEQCKKPYEKIDNPRLP